MKLMQHTKIIDGQPITPDDHIMVFHQIAAVMADLFSKIPVDPPTWWEAVAQGNDLWLQLSTDQFWIRYICDAALSYANKIAADQEKITFHGFNMLSFSLGQGKFGVDALPRNIYMNSVSSSSYCAGQCLQKSQAPFFVQQRRTAQ